MRLVRSKKLAPDFTNVGAPCGVGLFGRVEPAKICGYPVDLYSGSESLRTFRRPDAPGKFSDAAVMAVPCILPRGRLAEILPFVISSVAVYGHPPARERITEDEPLAQRLRFLDHYCRAKALAEDLVREAGPAATVVRPSWIIGPRDRHSLPRLVHALRGGWVKVQGTGTNLVNLVHAADVADGLLCPMILAIRLGS